MFVNFDLIMNGVYFIYSSGAPIYEIPKGMYNGEDLPHILLDAEIDTDRICRERPMQITESCTFVVDLETS